jgi:hypothetical protein
MKKIKLSLAGLPKMSTQELKKVMGGVGYMKSNGWCYDPSLGVTYAPHNGRC